jgi:UDP-galactose transporter
MHYSRIMPGYENVRYFASTAVLLNELLKLIFCSLVAVNQQGLKAAWEDAFAPDCWKLAIPAFLYTLQNSLQYVAVSNLDAATFQVTYQLKILTTAFFAVTILHKKLTKLQWLSLFMLTFGIAMVQCPPDAIQQIIDMVRGGSRLSARAESSGNSHGSAEADSFLGFVAVCVACVLSGLAGIYFEKVLKGSKKVSLWTRNVQLSFFSLFPALFIGVMAKDGAQINEKGFFYGYNAVVWLAILLQAGGGIIVALCVKFADNIAKNFATSISILISLIASVVFFDFVLTFNFIIGAAVVIGATYLYGYSPSAPARRDPEYKPVVDDSSSESK